MLLQHSTHDPLRCSLWCESHYTALLHLKRWWLWLSWCLHNFSSSLSALEILMYWGKPLNKNAPSMCANHPCKSSASAPPPQNKKTSYFLPRGFPEWIPEVHPTYISFKQCSEARHRFRQQRSKSNFVILITLQNDVRHPCSISFNFKYHVLHFGNRLHRSVWRLSQALQLVHADFPRHASERLFLRIPALGLSMLLYLFTQLTKKNKLRFSRLVEASALNLWCWMILSTQCL